MITGWQDVGQAGEIADLLHRLILVGKAQEIEVRVGHHDVFGLTANPAAHVHIAVRAAGARRIDIQAHGSVALLAGATTPAGDIERH